MVTPVVPMAPKAKKPKLTPAEKAAAKARAAAIKARNAEYKRVAKLLKAKDLNKRTEGEALSSERDVRHIIQNWESCHVCWKLVLLAS